MATATITREALYTFTCGTVTETGCTAEAARHLQHQHDNVGEYGSTITKEV